MTSHSNMIKRKAVDVSGRLGSLYDASTDNLIDRYSVQTSEIEYFNEAVICRIFSGDRSKYLLDYLKLMDFNSSLQLSIILGMAKTSGISSLIKHNQPTDENIRFVYYLYRNKEEQINVRPGKANQIPSPPSPSTRATHMITKILWGFEILCVVPVPAHVSADTVDSLLRRISTQLEKSTRNFTLTNTDKREIDQLINVTVYGSETCIRSPNTSLLTVLTNLKYWQEDENLHHPLM